MVAAYFGIGSKARKSTPQDFNELAAMLGQPPLT
jgi:hypothetical protein